MANTCDICGFVDQSKPPYRIVWVDLDGVKRCRICRHIIRYGRYVHNSGEEFDLEKDKRFTDYWKGVLAEVSNGWPVV